MPHKFKSFTTVAVLFIGYLIIYFDKSAIGYTILGMQHDFHFSNVQKGGVMSAFFIGYGVMQLPIALINNRLGSKRLLVWAMIGIALFAYLTNFATSIIVVALLRLLAASSVALYHPQSSVSSLKCWVAASVLYLYYFLSQRLLLACQSVKSHCSVTINNYLYSEYAKRRKFSFGKFAPFLCRFSQQYTHY